VRRIGEGDENDPWINDEIVAEIKFADGATTERRFPVPNLKIGEKTRLVLDKVYTAHPGQTVINLPVRPQPMLSIQPAQYKTIYSYQVRTEEQLWLSLLGVLVAGATMIGASAPGWTRLLPDEDNSATTVNYYGDAATPSGRPFPTQTGTPEDTPTPVPESQ
jgi:hypothetical protein